MEKKSIGLCIVLSLVTCGIYGIYWFVTLTDDTNATLGREDTSGGMSFLFTIVTCGIYGLYWAYKMGEKVDELKKRRGLEAGQSGILFLVLNLIGLGLIAFALIESELNDNIDPQDRQYANLEDKTDNYKGPEA